MGLSKFPIIALSGNVENHIWKSEMYKLVLEGNVVISAPLFTKKDRDGLTQKELDLTIQIHDEKIIMADRLHVVNYKNQPLTESTLFDIAHAKSLGKEITYMNDIKED